MRWLINMFRPSHLGRYTDVYVHQGTNFSECGPACLTMLLKKAKPKEGITRYACRKAQPTPSWWTARSIVKAGLSMGVALSPRSYHLERKAGIYLSSYLGFGHWVVAWKDARHVVHVLCPKRGYFTTTTRQFRSTMKSIIYVSSYITI